MSLLNLDFNKISKDMLTAAQGTLTDYAGDVKTLAEGELKDFARRTIELAGLVKDGSISPEQAKLILKIRQNAVETVFLSIAGIGLLAVQEAMNAILDVLKGAINSAIPGIDLF
jgi:hypothetical protein